MNKIKLLFTVIFAFIVASIYAAKADKRPFLATQNDGTKVVIYTFGDEDFNWQATADGVIVYQKNGNYYVAEISNNGELKASEQLVHEISMRSDKEKTIIKKQNKEFFYNQMSYVRAKNKAKREPIKYNNSFFPHTGSPKALIILAEFQDVKFSVADPIKTFNQYLNSMDKLEDYGNKEDRNAASVKKYFNDMSNGLFTPIFDVKTKVTLPHDLSHYGAGKDDMYTFFKDICDMVDGEINFSDYDANNDGNVDLIYVIYAGYSQSISGNSTDCIWPKSGTLSGLSYDGTNINRYGVNNELNGYPGAFTKEPYARVNGIGLFLHEFSHCMGLPDFYPTTSSAQVNNQGMEFWSIMDGGEYLDNGWFPPSYTAWEKESFGWFTINTLTNTQDNVTLANKGSNSAYRILNPEDKNNKEYFIIENIQKKGWNAAQKGHGLILYHVNYDENSFSLNYNTVNNIKGKPNMAIVPADSLCLTSFLAETSKAYYDNLGGDPYPGTSNVTTISKDLNVPNLKFYNGTADICFNIDNITETAEGDIVFNFKNNHPTAGIELIDNKENVGNRNNGYYSINGAFLGNDKHKLSKGIYIYNNKKIVIK